MRRNWLRPDWPAPVNVQAYVTTRAGGVSPSPWDSLNLGTHVGDDLARVRQNRALLRAALPEVRRFQWLNQVHGARLVDVVPGSVYLRRRTADAAAVYTSGDAAIVMTADCLPVFFCAQDGTAAAVAHAGWRGLLNGILENTVSGLQRAGSIPLPQLMVWMGPAIALCHFEVGDEVRQAFIEDAPSRGIEPQQIINAFSPSSQANKWMMDIYQVARLRLQAIGLTSIYGGDFCTVCEHQRFYSYRRDGVTGRMASLIYLKDL